MMNPKELAIRIADILEEKKGQNILVLDVAHLTSVTDYFVICSGTSSTQIRSLADEVEYKLSLCGITPSHTEGRGNGGWVLIDYGCVLVHVFSRDAREFYNLEKLYEGTSEQDISGLLTED